MGIFKKGKLEIAEPDKILDFFQMSVLSTAGYLIAKNNQDHIEDILKWYDIFKGTEGLFNIQEIFEDGTSRLATMISDDPFLQLQVRNAMTLVKISVEGPTVELDIGKYKEVVDSFMSGVMAGKMASL